ncbi:tyrosinase family protein [soil metagenome]
MSRAAPRVRRSLADVQADYDIGNKAELETLMRAWKGIKNLPPTDPRSFFMLGGLHGAPVRGTDVTDPARWGGFCQHGTVLFPIWHRAYLYALEKALQSIPGCERVMLPFWDECSTTSRTTGIPSALTDETFVLDGKTIANPLRSFVFPVAIVDAVEGDEQLYGKPAGYETVRYPLSGLVGTPAERAATAAHNALFPNHADNVALLNGNIVDWLNATLTFSKSSPQGHVYDKFIACLDAPSYTLFSNTTSMTAYNAAHPTTLVTAVESPHNSIHLAIGGFDLNSHVRTSIHGAKGDMGENDTAGLDPIFFFHHCFVDYTFWTWQKRTGATEGFAIDPDDPGAVYVASPSAGNQRPADADAAKPITMETPLHPFVKVDGTPFTTGDCVNIETQLGYGYGPGSLDQFARPAPRTMTAAAGDAKTLHVAGLDRGKIRGSFLIAVYAEIDGEKRLIGHEAVLSGWHIAGCTNCQGHLPAGADFRVPGKHAANGALRIEVRTHEGPVGGAPQPVNKAGVTALKAVAPAFTVELR